jgi:RNA-splicing ligase RtcB
LWGKALTDVLKEIRIQPDVQLSDAVLHLERGVELLSAGLDEVPGVYKDIHAVMAAQTDLVEVLGQFDPKLVKMCPAGDRAED